jgi:lipocalin
MSRNFITYIIILTIFCNVMVKSDINLRLGWCPKNISRSMKTFEISKYMGKWYEIARIANTPFQN